MARVTVEDCLENVKNRFELVMIAAKRARQLMRGSSEPKVAWENDKPTVVALREIAQGYTTFNDAPEVVAAVEAAVVIQHTSFDDDLDIDEDTSLGNQDQTDEPSSELGAESFASGNAADPEAEDNL